MVDDVVHVHVFQRYIELLVETSEREASAMTTKTLHRPLQTAEVARRAGCSVQLVRNLERDGVLESAARTPSGYRAWTEIHALAAATYVVLAAGVGAAEAKRFLRVARTGPEADVLALVDMAHARLHAERRDVELAGDAVAAISAETLGDVRPGDAMTISELAAALAVPTSTLRYWDRQGLLTPARAGGGHARVYAPPTSETRGSCTNYASRAIASRRCKHSCRPCGNTPAHPTSPPPSGHGSRTSTRVRKPSSRRRRAS
ncbi:hypothetical protein Asp14428_15490 [Actinoplanes sp. NBRC 14428]|nr:hypothetical protein Asp14428_15490 [Actinoplanes sp. NBRC 14428]